MKHFHAIMVKFGMIMQIETKEKKLQQAKEWIYMNVQIFT